MDAEKDPSGAVVVTLPYEEAVVLAELLWRWERQVLPGSAFEDQAEQRVLWDLAATFEAVITEVVGDGYAHVLASCRQKVRDPQE